MKETLNVKELLAELDKYKKQLAEARISDREYKRRVGGVNAAILIISKLAEQNGTTSI